MSKGVATTTTDEAQTLEEGKHPHLRLVTKQEASKPNTSKNNSFCDCQNEVWLCPYCGKQVFE